MDQERNGGTKKKKWIRRTKRMRKMRRGNEECEGGNEGRGS